VSLVRRDSDGGRVWRVCSCTPVLFSILPTKFCITVLAVVLLGTGAESRGTLKRMRGGRRAPRRPRDTDLDSRVVCIECSRCSVLIILCSRCFAIEPLLPPVHPRGSRPLGWLLTCLFCLRTVRRQQSAVSLCRE
jgi:hypothetical protein